MVVGSIEYPGVSLTHISFLLFQRARFDGFLNGYSEVFGKT